MSTMLSVRIMDLDALCQHPDCLYTKCRYAECLCAPLPALHCSQCISDKRKEKGNIAMTKNERCPNGSNFFRIVKKTFLVE